MGRHLGLPLFHLYGDPPDDSAFDFIHVETITSRAPIHDWTIRAHRHRNLFQILAIERGGGDMLYEAATIAFAAPAAILVPPTVAHGFRFTPEATEGWVVSFCPRCAANCTRNGSWRARVFASPCAVSSR
jgi:AraC family transcriptional regulator, transcriptional activator of pobA